MPKKLIEVALPLDAINAESAREKSIRHGHPSTLHLWWSRKPLATARAVIFASLVDDPSSHPELFPTETEQSKERDRLSGILTELVKWENSNNPEVLAEAKAEIKRSMGDDIPALLDPFAGGGAIPLEAQRLGLEAHAHDLNPVAVMINKAMIEIPPKFAGTPPRQPREPDADGARSGVERSERARGRRALLRRVDEARGVPPHRPPVPEGQSPERTGRRRGYRHRVEVGADRKMPEPGLRLRNAARELVCLV